MFTAYSLCGKPVPTVRADMAMWQYVVEVLAISLLHFCFFQAVTDVMLQYDLVAVLVLRLFMMTCSC